MMAFDPAAEATALAINPQTLAEAVRLLRAGEVVALPTETVYGLAANALDDAAVGKIYAIKSRPLNHPLIVHVPNFTAINHFAVLTDALMQQRLLRLLTSLAPGPLTVLLPRRAGVAEAASGGHPTIALRISAHPWFQAVVAHFHGLAAPSANVYGRISPTSAQHVLADLGDTIPLIVDGGVCAEGVESTIVNLCDSASPPVIMRPGPIHLQTLAEILDEPVQPMQAAQPKLPAAPGNVWRHYAPIKPFRAVAAAELASALIEAQAAGRSIGLMLPKKVWQSLPESLRPENVVCTADAANAYAQALYQNLRQLEAAAVAEMWLVWPENIEHSEWTAVRDRLNKALAQ